MNQGSRKEKRLAVSLRRIKKIKIDSLTLNLLMFCDPKCKYHLCFDSCPVARKANKSRKTLQFELM
jgi:hypothetical protein